MKVVMKKKEMKVWVRGNAPITLIKTRVSNNSPYITTTATLVPH